MLTYEERFFVLEGGLLKRLWRNVRLALWIAKILTLYYTKGRKIRRRYLECRQKGQPFWMDPPATP